MAERRRELIPEAAAPERVGFGSPNRPHVRAEEGDTVRQLLAILVLGLSAALPASTPDGSIEDAIDHEMTASGVPGLAYAVVADGEITFGRRTRRREVGGDTDVTPDTAFVIGSISKSFTAMAVMQLVEAGEVDLDTGLSNF